MKPILFNSEMVRAILEGRKTVTRRVVHKKYENTDLVMFTNKYGTRLIERQNDAPDPAEIIGDDGTKRTRHSLSACVECKPPFRKGDNLYVRESFCKTDWGYEYMADCPAGSDGDRCRKDFGYTWKPSIHMPKEAARIFLRVTDVRVDRLQDIDKFWSDYDNEGMRNPKYENISIAMQEKFISIWDSTIQKSDLDRFGWDANPWVWVIEFERISKEEALKHD
jgi:hypothetical protein